MQINIHEPEANLAQLLKYVMAGEEVIIESDDGKPIAKLVSYEQALANKSRIVFGVWKDKVKIADDFDELPPEIAEALGMDK